jgi:hypothetical protein
MEKKHSRSTIKLYQFFLFDYIYFIYSIGCKEERRECFLQYEKKRKKFYLTSTHKETLSCLCTYLKETGCTAKLRKIFHSIFSF